MKPADAARRLGVGRTSVHRFIVSGELAAVNVGNGSRPIWRIAESAIEAFVAKRSAP